MQDEKTIELATFVDNAVISCANQWKNSTGAELTQDDLYGLKNTLISFFGARKRGLTTQQTEAAAV